MREITVIGSRRMALFDDGEVRDKLRLFDMGVDFLENDNLFSTRNNGVEVIPTEPKEPLSLLCQHFLDSMDRGRALVSSGRSGLEVVRILEAAQASLDSRGTPVSLSEQ